MRPASPCQKKFLPERLDCGRFVVFHIENGIQLRYSFVICNRSWTFLVRFSSFSSPP